MPRMKIAALAAERPSFCQGSATDQRRKGFAACLLPSIDLGRSFNTFRLYGGQAVKMAEILNIFESRRHFEKLWLIKATGIEQIGASPGIDTKPIENYNNNGWKNSVFRKDEYQ